MIEFTVHGTAAPAGSKRGFLNPRTGRVMITDDSTRSRPWKAQVTDAAVQAMSGRDLLAGALSVTLSFTVARPKTHRGARGLRPSAPRFPTVRPDVDKLSRAVLDALTGVVYRDDAQIVRKLATKSYGEPARVEIRVMELQVGGGSETQIAA